MKRGKIDNEPVFHQFKLQISQGMCKVEGTKKQFNNLTEMLKFYEKEPVNCMVDNIGVQLSNRRFTLPHIATDTPTATKKRSMSTSHQASLDDVSIPQ